MKSKSGAYIWDGRSVRLANGMTTLLPWTDENGRVIVEPKKIIAPEMEAE
jgi:hypothetical protein